MTAEPSPACDSRVGRTYNMGFGENTNHSARFPGDSGRLFWHCTPASGAGSSRSESLGAGPESKTEDGLIP